LNFGLKVRLRIFWPALRRLRRFEWRGCENGGMFADFVMCAQYRAIRQDRDAEMEAMLGFVGQNLTEQLVGQW